MSGPPFCFNRKIVEVASFNFSKILAHSEYETFNQLDNYKYEFRYVGYRFISASRNLGLSIFILFSLTKLVFFASNILLFFAKKKNRCVKLRLRRSYINILENISTPSYFNFEMSTSIIQLTCALVYLRFSETYYA